MTLNYMALAVPLFLLLIGIEYGISKRLGVSCGASYQRGV